jgi:hypothetical protein
MMNRHSLQQFHLPSAHFSSVASESKHSCAEALAFNLELTIEGKIHKIPCANIKQCELGAFSYGFNCTLGFYLPNDQRQDQLLKDFISEKLIEVKLSITAVHNLPNPAPDPFKVHGLVTEKSLKELAFRQVAGNPVLYRYYQIHFADPAQVLWRQHYPCELFVDDCMSSVIKAQVFSPIKMTVDFSPAEEIKPMICLGLGNTDHHKPGESGLFNRASFYDFVIDYCDHNNAFFVYDYEQSTYSILGEAPNLKVGKPFLPHEIGEVGVYWPQVKRSTTHLLNGIANGSTQSPIANENAIPDIKHDIVVRYNIDNQLSERMNLETNRLLVQGEQLSVHFTQWPLQSFWPNCELQINPSVDGKTKFHADKSYRSHTFFIYANAIDNTPEQDLDLNFTQYHLNYQVHAHNNDTHQPLLPNYVKPSYPVCLEGLIVSDQGQDDEKTFDVPRNDDTGQFEYKVHIRLWDKTVHIMLEPDFLNSHFYFPFYRNTKLLVGLDLYRAHICKVLSWGDSVQLPQATQGNHILFGKKSGDETSLSHVYEDSKPVFAIKRCKEKDTELLRMQEGSIVFQTCEEP